LNVFSKGIVMEINAITGSIFVQPLSSRQNADRIPTRTTANREAETDIFAGKKELFAALVKRLEESNITSFKVSVNINVIKANLGNLLTTFLGRSETETLASLFTDSRISDEANLANVDVRERYISALMTAGTDTNSLFGGRSNSINSFLTNQNDGSQLLLNLLIEELGTPQEEATAILNTLQSQPFQTVA